MAMNSEHLLESLKGYFEKNAERHGVDLAFLYGSRAGGHPREDSDIDVAVMLADALTEETAFDVVSIISMELTTLLKAEINVLHIDRNTSKPMLYYNAIVHAIPLYMSNFTHYADVRNYAIYQMEDFSIFGTKWQEEVVGRRLERMSDD